MRATNWLGDAVMSLPAMRVIRQVFPHAHIALIARPWVADLYAREHSIDRIIPYTAQKDLAAKRHFASMLRREHFDAAILLQNAFDAALLAWLARIPVRIGYNRDARGLLLTHAIPVPEPGDIPRHERFYYLELLRRAGMMEHFPDTHAIRLEGIAEARAAGAGHLARLGIAGPVVGVSPGAAYGTAKRWLPERFAGRSRDSGARHGPAVRLGGRAPIVRDRRRTPARQSARSPQSGRRDYPARIYRSGGCVPPVSHQRFRQHARGLGAGCADRGRLRGYRRYHHRPHGPACPRGPRARRVQPLPVARMPHRPPLHDCRNRGPNRGCGARAMEGDRSCLDSRTKIVTPDAAFHPPRPLLLVTGRFDILRVEMARELSAARDRVGAGTLAVAILPLADELAPAAARAELAAALRVVDYVFVGAEGGLDALAAALHPIETLHLEEADAQRKRQLTEHVHRRHS